MFKIQWIYSFTSTEQQSRRPTTQYNVPNWNLEIGSFFVKSVAECTTDISTCRNFYYANTLNN